MAFFTRKRKIITAVAGTVLLAAAACVFVSPFSVPFLGGDNANAQNAQSNVSKYGLYKDDRRMGMPNAPVVIIEYASPACPHCGHFATTVMPQIKKEYIDTGRVLYVLRVFPIMSVDGAVEAVARCLPADKYFPYMDAIFRNQPKWDPEYNIADPRPGLQAISAQFGIDEAKFNQCVSSPDTIDRLNRIAQDGQTKYNIQSVPTFIINGEVAQLDVVDFAHFKQKIDAALARH